jgi:hypothetical protein
MAEGTEEVEDIEELNWFREVFRSQGFSQLFQKHAPSFDISIPKSSCLEGSQSMKYY